MRWTTVVSSNYWLTADVISLCKLSFHPVGAQARHEIVCKPMPFLIADDQSLQIIHLFNGNFPRKRTKIKDEIPMLSSYSKNPECQARELYLQKISVVGVYVVGKIKFR